MSTILLVEPDMLLAQTYMRSLALAGHIVHVARSAQAAVDALDEYGADLILLEIQLPAHNGVEFLHELRSYAEWQEIPVVVNSYMALSHLSHVREALRRDLGVAAILYKPQLSLDELTTCVRRYAGVPA